MSEQQYNTCPRCIRSGVGACDDFPDCQEPRTTATDYLLMPDGSLWQLVPSTIDYAKLRESLACTPPEELYAAAQRYMRRQLGIPEET